MEVDPADAYFYQDAIDGVLKVLGKKKFYVTVAQIDHKHGTDIYIGGPSDNLDQIIYDNYIVSCWANAGDEFPEIPSDPRTAIDLYFDEMSNAGEEWLAEYSEETTLGYDFLVKVVNEFFAERK